MTEILIKLVGLIILIELFTIFIVKKIRNKFQWFIFNKDVFPNFNESRFNNYIKNSYDKDLGWKRKSNITGYDHIGKKKIKFSIDKKGSRMQTNKKKVQKYASFGGSYVFGRQVEDNHTWQEFISNECNFNILNFGIGNYGTDQAILRYKNTKLSKKTKNIILGIVPEHICRIQSEWKHFFEFGNIHGFKPKCFLKNGKLFFKKNPLVYGTKLKNIKNVIKKLKQTDRFFEEKFKKNIFQYPFILSFIRNFKFNFKVVLVYLKYFGDSKQKDHFLKLVIQRNIIEAHNLYLEEYSKKLFLELIKYFKYVAKKRGQKVTLIIFPQFLDILNYNTSRPYRNYFKNIISKEIKTLDLTKYFKKIDVKKLHKLFINDIYGGHLNKEGNKFVSKIILDFLKNDKK